MEDDIKGDWYGQAIIQILLAKGITDSESLQSALLFISKDFSATTTSNNSSSLALKTPLERTFSELNKKLRLVGLEIKTVVMKTDGNLRYYHGIANTEDDIIAKTIGSKFEPHDLKYFNALCQKLIDVKFLNTPEATELAKGREWNRTTAAEALH